MLQVLVVGPAPERVEVVCGSAELALLRCADVDEALARADAAGGRCALLYGPVRVLDEGVRAALARLSRGGRAVFLLVDADEPDEPQRSSAWPCLLEGVQDVLGWADLRRSGLVARLGRGIAHAARCAELARCRARAEALHAVCAALARAESPQAVGEVVVEGALALLPCAAVALFDLEEDDLVLTHSRGVSEREQRRSARVSVDAAPRLLREAARGRAAWSSAASVRSPTQRSEAERAFTAALPLGMEERRFGVLALEIEGIPSSDDQLALVSLADDAARARQHVLAVGQLRERAQLEQRLLGIAVHDLRSPLQVIVMASELLSAAVGLSGFERSLVMRVRDSALRATSAVGEALAIARSRLGRVGSQLEAGDAFEVLRSAVEVFRARTPECPIELVEVGSGEALIDRAHLTVVVHNLLSNAVRYREPGTSLKVRGEGRRERVYVEVTNSGSVIDQHAMAELFEPLKRSVRENGRGSLGLGLFIVKSLVEADGGRVWARSSTAEGTTFVVELPRVGEPERSLPSLARSAEAPPGEVPPELAPLCEVLTGSPLRELLTQWLELGAPASLPHPRQLDHGRLLAQLPDMFTVEVLRSGGSDRPLFRFVELGGALLRRLNGMPRRLIGAGAGERLEVSLHEAYLRCVTSGRPQVDYLRTGPSKAGSESVVRLVLPFSEDGRSVTHLIGGVRFEGFGDARVGTDEPTPLTTTPEGGRP